MKATFVKNTDLRPGMRTALGLIESVTPSKSGKTIAVAIQTRSGIFVDRVSSLARGAVFTDDEGLCRYATFPDDPAIRVCITHDPDFGLYGDELCARERTA